MQNNLIVLILTYNEVENIEQCLRSVEGWASEIYVIDSGSTDGTLEKLRNFNVKISFNAFINFSKQRNFALNQLSSDYDGWVLFLDADEYLTPEIKREISQCINDIAYTNYFLNRKFYWQNKWIKRGYYPCNIIRLFKNGYARCEDRSVNEHLIVTGRTGYIREPFIHQCNKPISYWIEKHIIRAKLEAAELFITHKGAPKLRITNNRVETKRWVRLNIWQRLPIFIRPFMLFFFRLFIQGGILDGRRAFGYHFLQTLWFTMLIDIFYLDEIIKRTSKNFKEKS
jgi:glycosyltransferase involved in cell wall biosynthesis